MSNWTTDLWTDIHVEPLELLVQDMIPAIIERYSLTGYYANVPVLLTNPFDPMIPILSYIQSMEAIFAGYEVLFVNMPLVQSYSNTDFYSNGFTTYTRADLLTAIGDTSWITVSKPSDILPWLVQRYKMLNLMRYTTRPVANNYTAWVSLPKSKRTGFGFGSDYDTAWNNALANWTAADYVSCAGSEDRIISMSSANQYGTCEFDVSIKTSKVYVMTSADGDLSWPIYNPLGLTARHYVTLHFDQGSYDVFNSPEDPPYPQYMDGSFNFGDTTDIPVDGETIWHEFELPLPQPRPELVFLYNDRIFGDVYAGSIAERLLTVDGTGGRGGANRWLFDWDFSHKNW